MCALSEGSFEGSQSISFSRVRHQFDCVTVPYS